MSCDYSGMTSVPVNVNTLYVLHFYPLSPLCCLQVVWESWRPRAKLTLTGCEWVSTLAGNQWMSCKVTKVQGPLHSWVLMQAEYFNKNTSTIILQQEYCNMVELNGASTAVLSSFAKLTFPGASRWEPLTPCRGQKMPLNTRKEMPPPQTCFIICPHWWGSKMPPWKVLSPAKVRNTPPLLQGQRTNPANKVTHADEHNIRQTRRRTPKEG